MIDACGLLTTYLRADAVLMIATGGNVYCETVPDHPGDLFVLARTVDAEVTAPPSMGWDTYGLTVDVVGVMIDTTGCADAVSQVRDRVATFTGLHGDATVASTSIDNTTYLIDDSVSPARPRWVVAASVVARTTTTT